MLVHINTVNVNIIEIQIPHRDMCIELLKFILDGVSHGQSGVWFEVTQATGQWIFYGDDFRFAASQDEYDLSASAKSALAQINSDFSYYEADKFIIHVPLADGEDHHLKFNEYKVVR